MSWSSAFRVSNRMAGYRGRVRGAFLLVLGGATLCASSHSARAEEAEETVGYRAPSQIISDIVLAPPTPQVSLSPDEATLLILEVPSFPPLAELAERELRLAGFRIKPQTNGPSRSRPYTALRFLDLADLKERPVTGLPPVARLENVRWSPDGTRIAFTNTTPQGIELWTAEVASGRARRLTDPVLSLVSEIAPTWLSDNRSLVCVLVPEKRGPEPPVPAVPEGPTLQESAGRAAPARTYQDLLKNASDEALFAYYFTAQAARVTVDGKVRRIGGPGLLSDLSPSPDGRYLFVETLHRPFSYLVPADRFPRRVEIMDADGRLVRQVADLPLEDGIPVTFGSVAAGPREFTWRADVPAALCWAEAQDGGDAGRAAEVRDKLFLLAAPFAGEPVELAALDLRYGGVEWGSDNLAVVSSWWWKTRMQKSWIVAPGAPATPARKLFEYSSEDRYKDPGNLAARMNATGQSVLDVSADGGSLFLIGDGASEEGDRPFLDRLSLSTLTTERLFRSEAPYYERPVVPLEGTRVLTRRESVSEPPNFFVRDLGAGTLRPVTTFPHPTPQLAGIQKELIRYKRKDGVDLTGTLYLPAGYTPAQGPLPMVMWAYPQEFKSASAAGQVTDSPYRFVRVSWASPILWVAQGYSVLDDPSMPIVGEGDVEPNDTYVAQLTASAEAAVDEVVRRGVAERGRIAIGGHSYGAFTAANLLAHTDLFAAGIARSGAYNRSLTPFGFQSEERTMWQAPEVYYEMSPFRHADKVNEPLLLIHGEADNNSGTFPIQSERFYSALKGLGATVRLVMLPLESHGYRAQESILHMLWETEVWLDKYVKQAPGQRP